MKSNTKSKIIILITLGVFIGFSALSNDNLNFNVGNSDDSNLDNKNLQISAVSGKIHIDNNWTAAKSAGICTGNGTYSEPYVIEDLVIDAGGSGSDILIENSDVYFKIENCSVYNSGTGFLDAGIKLEMVSNGLLLNNNVSNNEYYGIYLGSSDNNTISGNTANNNTWYGIGLSLSDYNIISGNTANAITASANLRRGIYLQDSLNNVISGNTANYNFEGIYIWVSDNNTISGNTANYNDYGIRLFNSNNTTISGNIANNNTWNGIHLFRSGSNTISGNTVNYNTNGILLDSSDNNMISGNTLIRNEECILEINSQGNKFSGNGACTYGQRGGIIPGYNLFFLLGILSIVAIILSKKLKKS